MPHVVWCTHPLYAVFYSRFDGHQWVVPTPVNDTAKVTASPWADPRIAIDRNGVVHVSFTGAKVGASHRDIFYAFNDGKGWSPCQMVTRDSLYDEWTSDIAADNRDNVWIAWDRQNEGSDDFRVYASQYNGREFSAEQRLDNDSAYYDFGPSICLDAHGEPWVVWEGFSYETGGSDIYYNRVADAGSLEEKPTLSHPGPTLAVASCNVDGPVKISYIIRSDDIVRIEVFDLLGKRMATLVNAGESEGRHELLWDATKVPAGTYFCRLTAGDSGVTSKIIVIGR
jgi:hypothetical protein